MQDPDPQYNIQYADPQPQYNIHTVCGSAALLETLPFKTGLQITEHLFFSNMDDINTIFK